MLIGTRTIKTAIGTGISIAIAQGLGLDYYATAGIITILCIQNTRRQTIQTSLFRIAASLLVLLFAWLFFTLLGFHAWTIALILLLFLPVLVRLKIQGGFVTSAVILLHIFTVQQMTIPILLNEMSLVGIGVIIAMLMNLWMPSYDKELVELQKAIEHNFRTILKEFAIYLQNGESDWNGKEMLETAQLLDKAIKLAALENENRILRSEKDAFDYFVMREKQFGLLERMMPIVSSLHLQVPQGRQLAEFLDDLGTRVHPGNTAYLSLERLRKMREAIDQTPLPQSQEEFGIRAALFYLIHEIEEYLYIKHNLGRD
ncbi:MAG: aromatic acid exporter family protein [Clostridia bacterium]